MWDEDPYPDVVVRVAEKYGLDVKALDWEVEAVMGWEPHDPGYDRAVLRTAHAMRSRPGV